MAINDQNIHDIVIVGAGPVGLALALGLARREHDILVIKKMIQPLNTPALRLFGRAHKRFWPTWELLIAFLKMELLWRGWSYAMLIGLPRF